MEIITLDSIAAMEAEYEASAEISRRAREIWSGELMRLRGGNPLLAETLRARLVERYESFDATCRSQMLLEASAGVRPERIPPLLWDCALLALGIAAQERACGSVSH